MAAVAWPMAIPLAIMSITSAILPGLVLFVSNYAVKTTRKISIWTTTL